MSKRALRRLLLAGTVVLVALAVVVAAAARRDDPTAPPNPLPGGRAITADTILFVIYSPPSSPWGQTLNGIKAAKAITGLRVRVVYASTERQLAAVIRSGIAAHVAGMALNVPSPAADSAICAASEAGIPVVAWNNNGYGAEASRCVLAYMGSDLVDAGRTIAQYMAKHGHIKRGAHVFCPTEIPDAVYSKRRAQGVDSVLSSYGARCDVVGVGFDDDEEQAKMIAYLRRHPETDLVIPVGGTPLANAPAVLKALGRRLPVAGFDIADGATTRIIDGIQGGQIVATVDQQFYSQAFQSLVQLALYLKYGLFPSNVNTSNNSVVDNTNAGLAARLSGTYR